MEQPGVDLVALNPEIRRSLRAGLGEVVGTRRLHEGPPRRLNRSRAGLAGAKVFVAREVVLGEGGRRREPGAVAKRLGVRG